MSEQVRVCLIDDDIYVRDAMTIGLRDAGYHVVAAPGAAAGLDVIERGGADVIVTDLHMPGADGSQLIAEARKRWPDLPIIAITGAATFGGVDAEDVARASGANALMSKPFAASALADLIKKHLSPPA